MDHLTKLAEALDLKRAAAIVSGVRQAVSHFEQFAEEEGVPPRLRAAIAKVIAPGMRATGRGSTERGVTTSKPRTKKMRACQGRGGRQP